MIIHFRDVGLPFASWKTVVFGIFSLAALYIANLVYKSIIYPLFSSLRDLPGPKSPSLLYGYFVEIFKAEPGKLHEQWVEAYGPTLNYKLLFNRDRFMTLDTKALSHILNHSYEWQKPPALSAGLAQILGEGLLFVEGDSHKRQRRIINPSFSLSHLRELTPIFLEKSAQLRDIWLEQSMVNSGNYQTDVLAWFSRATLDMIGLAGFNYDFNALGPNGQGSEFSNAFLTIFRQIQRNTVLGILQSFVPPLRLLPTKRNRVIAKARKVMDRIGRQLVDDKRRAILASSSVSETNSSLEAPKIEKSSITTRDLLSRLMAANMATDLRENQRLSDKDVFAQIPTFIIAGHETTASAATWCLYALARDHKIQSKLREELHGLTTPMPSMEELNALPYLDAVVHETLRLHPVVTMTVRMATKDDVIPLGTPFKDKNGNMRHEIRVRKGESVIIPIIVLNTHRDIWGDDCKEFRPERWLHVPEKANEIPGVWGNVLSFIGGPRSCIGYRFALIEVKSLIWTLVSAFAFDFVDPAHRDGIIKKNNVAKPFVKSEPEKGTQLPLRVTPWKAA